MGGLTREWVRRVSGEGLCVLVGGLGRVRGFGKTHTKIPQIWALLLVPVLSSVVLEYD